MRLNKNYIFVEKNFFHVPDSMVPIPMSRLTVKTFPPGIGDVIGGGVYPTGTTVTILAINKDGEEYDFLYWESGERTESIDVTLDENKTFVAVFSPCIDAGWCGDNVSYCLSRTAPGLDTYKLELSGTGPTTNYTKDADLPWASSRGKIVSLIVNDGVTTLGDYLFSSTTNLVTVQISDTVETIGTRTFNGCQNMRSFDLKNVTSIGDYAFCNCNYLDLQDLGKVEHIGSFAFMEAGGLICNLPETFISVGNNPWDNMDQLTAFTISENNPVFSVQDGVLYNKDKTTLISYPTKRVDSAFTIPETVTRIEAYAFEHVVSTKITELVPRHVTRIGSYAFLWAEVGPTLYIHENVVRGNWVFAYNSTRTSIILAPAVKDTYWAEFFKNYNITTFILPVQPWFPGYKSQYDWRRMTELDLNCCTTTIGDTTFQEWYSLLTLKIGVKVVNANAFTGNQASYIEIKDCCTSIASNAIKRHGGNPHSTRIVLGTGLTKLNTNSFNGYAITGDLIIPDNIQIINNDAFGSTTLEVNQEVNLIIGSGLTSLAEYAFRGLNVVTYKNNSTFNIQPGTYGIPDTAIEITD